VGGDVALDLVEARGIVGQAEEDQPFENPDVATMETELRAVEVRRHVARGEESPVRRVHPGMVGTDEPGGAAGLFETEARAAVAAHVEQRVNAIPLPADHDDRLRADAHQEVVPRPGNAADVARDQPVAQEDAFDVALEDHRIAVERAVERPAVSARWHFYRHRTAPSSRSSEWITNLPGPSVTGGRPGPRRAPATLP